MVRGLESFRSFFREFCDNYILIGGAACEEHFHKAGLTFRATKDLDLILIVEALNPEFVRHFWGFVKAGEYKEKQISGGERKYYRFLQPAKNDYPVQIELFARNPDLLDLAKESVLTPIPVDEDLSSLSAILMNDDYYGLTIKNSEISDNLHLATITTLICLKAKAFLDLTTRKGKGENIDGNDIKKHRNDAIRLSVLLKQEDSLLLPGPIALDIQKFLKALETEPPDFRAIGKPMGIPFLSKDSVLNQLTETFLK